jgi:maleylpyruvate isomerase
MISDITDELSGSGAPTAWVEGCVTAQAALDRALEGLEDATARNPSLLPGWSVGHLLTHLARNADSVVWRLAGGAGGEQRDQYPGGMTQRHNDIEDGAGRPAGELVLDVRRTSQAVERVT